MMDDYAAFGARIVTGQGNRLALAGLCPPERLAECESGLEQFRTLRFSSKDPVEIDRAIAGRLAEAYRGKAAAVGAAVSIEGISQEIFRTGGVLGRPEFPSEDAGDELEALDGGLWMYTASGGPGWIGRFSRETAGQLARLARSHQGAYPVKANDLYRRLLRLSPQTYLFVSDGTGYDSFGLCAVKSGGKELAFIV